MLVTGGRGGGCVDNNPENGPPHHLPDEMWEEIFGWLDSLNDLCACTATCRTWAALCWRERRHICLHIRRTSICNIQQKQLQEEECNNSLHEAMGVVARRCGRKLEGVELIGHQVILLGPTVSTLLDTCPRLSSLRINRCHPSTPTSVVRAAAENPEAGRLKALQLCGMQRLNDALIEACFQQFSALRWLSLEGCRKLTNVGLSLLPICCPLLQTLQLKVTAGGRRRRRRKGGGKTSNVLF